MNYFITIKMAIATEQFTIKALFLRKETCVVPKYQRGYAWDDGAIDDFIRGLSKCLSLRMQKRNPKVKTTQEKSCFVELALLSEHPEPTRKTLSSAKTHQCI